jgi:hypothetical protein
MSGGSRRFQLGVGALAVGALANVAILEMTPLSSWPFRPHDNASLLELVETEQRSLAFDHAFYLELREVGVGLTLVAEEGLLDPVSVDGLADMELAIAPTPEGLEPSAITALDGLAGSVRLSDDGPTIDYLVVAPGPDERRMRVLIVGDTLVAVGERLLETLVTP